MPPSRDGRDDAGRINASDAVVSGIRDVEIAERVDRHASGKVDLGAGRGAAVAREPRRPGARDGDDGARSIDASDAVVERIGDVEVAERVDRDAGGAI
jgi:hypothetical protein